MLTPRAGPGPVPPIPTPATVTREWLTACLRGAGHPGTEVVDFTATRIGTGQIGQCVRFELELEQNGAGADAPRSLIGKFPSDDAVSRDTGVTLRNYYREVQFYSTLAERLAIATPKCYYAAIDGEGPDFVLLLEDMHPAEPGNQLIGCDPAAARGAVRELVGLQAPSWCDATLLQHDWLHQPNPTMDIRDLYAQTLPGFIDRYGDELAADEIDVLSRVAAAPGCPLFAPLDTPYCLEHVDYRLDNMLIDTRVTPPRVTVVDWQSVKVGRPLNDVAYFLGAGLVPEVRREVERDIVRDYHRALEQAGIDDLDWQACWEAYRRSTFAGFGVTVIASMIVQQTPRGDQMFLTMARRHSRHAIDLGAAEYLG